MAASDSDFRHVFFVSMSLSDEGVDPETTVRFRYNSKGTLSKGTFEEGRNALKDYFYGPRILYCQEFFNCSHGVFVKRALKSVQFLLGNVSGSNTNEKEMKSKVASFFAVAEDKSNSGVMSADGYVQGILSEISQKSSSFGVHIHSPVPAFVLDDYRVVSIEDVYSSSLQSSSSQSRVVIYQLNEFGKITNARVFDQSAEEIPCNNVLRAQHHFYDAVDARNAKKVQNLFSDNSPIIEFPVGAAPMNVTSFTSSFFAKMKSMTRSAQRTYVNGNQVAQVLEFQDSTDRKAAVHVLTFNADMEVTRSEWFSK